MFVVAYFHFLLQLFLSLILISSHLKIIISINIFLIYRLFNELGTFLSAEVDIFCVYFIPLNSLKITQCARGTRCPVRKGGVASAHSLFI